MSLSPDRLITVRAHTRAAPTPKPKPESLDHAIDRMRSQGYTNVRIAGEVRRWHPDWSNADIVDRVMPKQVPLPPSLNPKGDTRFTKPPPVSKVIPVRTHTPASTPSLEPVGPTHGASKRFDHPLYPGQKPSGYEAVGRRPGRAGIGSPVTSRPYWLATRGPAGDQASQLSSAQLVKARQAGVHPTVAMALLNATTHPLTDLSRQAPGETPFKLKGAASDVANIASNFAPVGKAAGIFGLGLKGLKAARTAKLAEAGVETAAKVAPHATEEAAQLREGLKGAASVRGKTDVGFSEQRREINARVAKIYADKSLSIAERQRLADAVLSGPLKRPTFTGLMKLKGPGLDNLTAQIMEHPQLQGRGFTQKRLIKSLHAAVGGKVPTKSELKLFDQVFGKAQTAGIVKAARTGRLKDILENVVNVPRTMQATLDMSALLRQNLVAFAHSPMTTVRNAPLLVKSFASEKQAVQDAAKMAADPDWPLLKDMGVSFTGAANPQQEEQFGAQMLEQVGGRANPIHWSSRSYSTFLNRQRFDLGKKLLGEARARGYNVHDPQFGQDLSRAINDFTGRGHLPGETLQRSAKLLNGLFFSPRLLSSRFRLLLSPANIALAKRNPYIYRQYLKAFVRTFGALTAVLYAAKRAGVDVETDPRSSDFGKMKFGNTRIDLAGGFQQFAHLAGEIAKMEKKSTTTGQTTNLRSGKYGQPTLYDVLTEFLASKASPPLSLAIDVTKNQTDFGKFDPKKEAYQRLTPLSAQDAVKVAQDRSKGPLGLAEIAGAGALSIFGANVQTYGRKVPKVRGGVSDSGGNPLLRSSSSGGSNPLLRPSSTSGGGNPLLRP